MLCPTARRPPNSSVPPGAQQDGQGGQLPTTALGAGVRGKGDLSHRVQHRDQCLTLSLLSHLQEATLNHTIKNSSIFPPGVNQELSMAGQPSQRPPGDTRDTRRHTGDFNNPLPHSPRGTLAVTEGLGGLLPLNPFRGFL